MSSPRPVVLLIVPALLVLGLCASSPWAAPDSVARKVERIDSLVGQLEREIGTLKSMLAAEETESRPDTDTAARARDGEPTAMIFMSEAQKRIMRNFRGEDTTTALGMAFGHYIGESGDTYDPQYPVLFALTFQHWLGRWGVKSSLGFNTERRIEYGFVNLALLRSIKRFTIGKREFTHLYAMAEVGGLWRDRSYYDQNAMRSKVFSEPDRVVHGLAGFGIDINVFDGWKITPELGYRVNYFVSRYQDSDEWPRASSGGGYTLPEPEPPQPPRSDVSVNVYAALNLNLFFR
jgi:hypothetical protein